MWHRWIWLFLAAAVAPQDPPKPAGADPAAHLYDFPWPAGKTYPVLAGNGEGSTHQGDFHYSWDFLIPAGDVIVAAREGVVESVWDDAKAKRGLGVMINHGDGTHALYGHLLRGSGGILVKKGERVWKGEPIAKIGPEAGGAPPHLHFHVTTDERLRTMMSAPVAVNFKGEGAKAWRPRRGDRCTSETVEPAHLADLRKIRRVKPLLDAAVALRAYDFALEAKRAVPASSAPRSDAAAELLKSLGDLDRIDALDEDLLKEIDRLAGARAYERALFATAECGRSKLKEEFAQREQALRENVSAEEQQAAKARLAARRLLLRGLRDDLKGSWDAARSSYAKAAQQKDDDGVARLAGQLHDAITPSVR
jgi:hypothetical protein